ncbi:MAG: 30S ribosomal protein S9 [bacterium]|nr:30S ribosomal protein S9 [bacterium]
MTKISTTTDAIRTVGRRKSAAARVRIEKGTGKFVVNGKELNKYFPTIELQNTALAPLKALAKEKDLDVSIKVAGGGMRGQAEAVRHGLSRALLKWNEDFKKTLRALGFLTRDARVKERKKFGLKRARKSPQWSKR